MSQYTFKDLEAVVNDVVSTTIQQHFEESLSLYNKFSKRDEHPWTSDLRSLARMLNGDIELPHAKVNVQNKVCEICTKAFMQQVAYKLELMRQEKERMAGILSKEN